MVHIGKSSRQDSKLIKTIYVPLATVLLHLNVIVTPVTLALKKRDFNT